LKAERQAPDPPSAHVPYPCPRQGPALDATPIGGIAAERVGPAEGWQQMRKLTTVIGLVLVLALGLVASVGRSQPARAAAGDSVVLAWNQRLLDTFKETRDRSDYRRPSLSRGPHCHL
jgi:hypothetical protein